MYARTYVCIYIYIGVPFGRMDRTNPAKPGPQAELEGATILQASQRKPKMNNFKPGPARPGQGNEHCKPGTTRLEGCSAPKAICRGVLNGQRLIEGPEPERLPKHSPSCQQPMLARKRHGQLPG